MPHSAYAMRQNFMHFVFVWSFLFWNETAFPSKKIGITRVPVHTTLPASASESDTHDAVPSLRFTNRDTGTQGTPGKRIPSAQLARLRPVTAEVVEPLSCPGLSGLAEQDASPEDVFYWMVFVSRDGCV